MIYNILYITTYNFNLRFSPASTFLITNISVSNISLHFSFNSFLQKRKICLFDERHGWKNQYQLKRTALKQKNKKHTHAGKELGTH
jgi:hypothetical protein